MICQDWRDAPYAEIEALYEGELDRWRSALHWDLQGSWDIVEAARSAGRLPGLLCRDEDGRTRGWAFYLLFDGMLQIGGLVADSGAAVRLLLDRILDTPEAALARGVSCFVFPNSAALASALGRRRFAIQRFLYLGRGLTGGLGMRTVPDFVRTPAGDVRLRLWEEADAVDGVRLLARAYEGAESARCFAPHGRVEEWAYYLSQLLRTPACGVFLPAGTFVAEDARTGEMLGFVLGTALAPGTAHIAQVVVAAQARGGGLGATLVRAACASAGAAGYERMSLLVAERNAPARALYDRLGFVRAGEFVFGAKGPSRVDRPALHWQAAVQ